METVEKPMVQEIGVNETKDVIIAVNKVAILLIKQLKDGVDMSDAMAFWNAFISDGHIKDAVTCAYENYNKIPAEVANLSVAEALELAKMQMDYVPKILEALKS